MLEQVIDELRSLLPLARGDERSILARNIARLEQMVPPADAVALVHLARFDERRVLGRTGGKAGQRIIHGAGLPPGGAGRSRAD